MGCAAWHPVAFTLMRLHQLQKLEQVYCSSNLDGTAREWIQRSVYSLGA
jgi:hypothetical protein